MDDVPPGGDANQCRVQLIRQEPGGFFIRAGETRTNRSLR
jgi:hypothetical protein